MDPMPGGPLAGLHSAISAAMPPGGGGQGGGGHAPHSSLNPMQFGKFLGGGGGEAAGGAAAGGEGLAELAPLLLAA
jgi:hypothetical protein